MGNVVRAVRSAFNYVCKAVKAVVHAVVKIVVTVVTTIRKVVKFFNQTVTKVKNFISDTYQKAKDWFFETRLGKAIIKAKNYIMEKTFIGDAINWVKQKVGNCVDYFFKQTWLGRGICTLAEKFNNSAVGRFFHEYLSPIVKIASWALPCLGLAGGIIGKGLNIISKVTGYVDKLKDIPGNAKNWILNNRYTNAAYQFCRSKMEQFTNYATQKITNSSLFQRGEQVCERAKDKAGSFFGRISEKYHTVKGKVEQKISQAKNTLGNTYTKVKQKLQNSPIYEKSQHLLTKISETSQTIKNSAQTLYTAAQAYAYSNPYIAPVLQKISPLVGEAKSKFEQKFPTIVNAVYKGYRFARSQFGGIWGRTQDYARRVCQPYVDRFNQSKAGNILNPALKVANVLLVKPLKQIAKHTLGTAYNKLKDKLSEKIKNSSIYQSLKYLNDVRSKGVVQSYFQKTIKEEMKIQGLSSQNMMAGYFQKYGGDTDEKVAINKLNKIFQYVSQHQQEKPTNLSKNKPLKDYILNKQVTVDKITFNARGTDHEESSIGGKMTLTNQTPDPKQFLIESGTMFGCQKFRSSQHVVVKQLQGHLEPKQTKQFNLNGFCACSSLDWPYQDSNYDLTSFKMRQFRDNLDQYQVWDLTD